MPWMARAVVAFVLAGCAGGPGVDTLGGRETCWSETESRAASLWRGVLEIDASGARLKTSEGDAVPIRGGTLAPRLSDRTLVHGDDVVARSGEELTLFGGAGADGILVVCAIETRH
jgi:hypothetical protein